MPCAESEFGCICSAVCSNRAPAYTSFLGICEVDHVCATLGDCWYTSASADVGCEGARGLEGVGTEWVYRADEARGDEVRVRGTKRIVRARDMAMV
jgi:hypothetical protein